MNKSKLSKKDLNRVSRRWMPMAVNTFNYQSQLAASVVFSTYPALRKIYEDDAELDLALENHYKYFNCQPFLAPIIFGATLAIEDNEGIESVDIVQNLKTSLMGPLSGIGDTLIWVLYPTIVGSITAYMALEFNYMGAVIWMLLNVVIMGFRFKAVHLGYYQGTKLIDKLGDKITDLTDSLSILGIIVVGALVPTVIKVGTPIVFTSGEVTTSLQEQLDAILPAMIPVAIVFAIYKLIKLNKISVTWIIMLVIVFSMLMAGFGILA